MFDQKSLFLQFILVTEDMYCCSESFLFKISHFRIGPCVSCVAAVNPVYRLLLDLVQNSI
jgi:hypothetical protein